VDFFNLFIGGKGGGGGNCFIKFWRVVRNHGMKSVGMPTEEGRQGRRGKQEERQKRGEQMAMGRKK